VALVDRTIEHAKREAEDTLRQNEEARLASQRRLAEINVARSRSERQVRTMRRRLRDAGVASSDDE
jgi:hypothetical protein